MMSLILVLYYDVAGIKDFPPDILNEGGIFSPAQYSPFTSLIDKARVWINQSRVSIFVDYLIVQLTIRWHLDQWVELTIRWRLDQWVDYAL